MRSRVASARSSVEPVDVHRRTVGADRDDDEVAVPGRELLELREQLLALGAALRAPHALLGLARRQLEALHLHLLELLRLRRRAAARSRAARAAASAGSNAARR